MNYKITFNNKSAPFMAALNEKVNTYFSGNQIAKTGNWKIFTKSLVLFPTHIALYVLMVSLHFGSVYNVIAAILLGFTSALIGFNAMHDGSHGSYSKNKTVNLLMGYSLNLLGGEAYFWRTKHNVLHHTYTNISGLDDDIEKHPLFRFCKQQERRWFHRFQHLYWIFLYPLSSIFWIYIGDYKKYFSGKIIGEYKYPKMNLAEHITFWITKIANLFLFIVLPIYTIGLMPALVCFFTMHFVLSVTLTIVFQLAHAVEKTSFGSIEEGNIEKEWAVHQIETTADFAPQSRLLAWLLGGLNFQVEHHLFPKISHVHYPALNKFIKETCLQFNITYIENRTFFGAFRSHILYLKKLGSV
jgi:linoleoyl-CoA desaturase